MANPSPDEAVRAPRLTRPMRGAIAAALDAALAGDGFDGGDFDGMKREHFERALSWINHKSRNDKPEPSHG